MLYRRTTLFGFAPPWRYSVIKRKSDVIYGKSYPALYVCLNGDLLEEAPVECIEIKRYCLSNSALSYTRLKNTSRIVGMFFDYMMVREKYIKETIESDPIYVSEVVMSEFVNHIVHGTISYEHSGIQDITGLYWRSCPSEGLAKALIWAFEDFLRYLSIASKGGRADETGAASQVLKVLGIAENGIRKNPFGLLSYLNKTDPVQSAPRDARKVIPRDRRTYLGKPSKRFPLDLLMPFLTEAYTSGSNLALLDSEDPSGHMDALLQTGGARGSENLHYWATDFTIQDGQLSGHLFHPQQYIAPGEAVSRQAILESRYHCLPRNLRSDKSHAGWKGVLLEKDQSAPIYWMPLDGLPELLARAFAEYIVLYRAPAMAERRRRGLRDHPFLLVFPRDCPTNNVVIGEPYTAAAARGSWSRAIKRLALIFPERNIVESKYNGTSRHGFRHLYGHLIASTGVDEKIIQSCMHHISILSSRVYTRLDDCEINRLLNQSNVPIKRSVEGEIHRYSNYSDQIDEMILRVSGKHDFR